MLRVATSATGDKTWQQLQLDVACLAAELETVPVQRWAMCFQDSYWLLVALLGVAAAGRQGVLPGNTQPAALQALTGQFDGLLCDDDIQLGTELPVVRLAEGYFCECMARHHTAAVQRQFAVPLDLATTTLLLFTSGSSGVPKCVSKSFQQLENEINQLEACWGAELDSANCVVSTVSHQHIYGLLFRVIWPLCAGRCFERLDRIYPEQVMAHADPETILISSPALLRRLPPAINDRTYRRVFSSGGPLPYASAIEVEKRFGQLAIEVFGSTETGGIGYRQQVNNATPWRLFPGIQAQLDPAGCLRILSPFIDLQHWYQTQDQCDLVDGGRFILKGRADRIVKIEEKRISLVEVEQRLCQLDWVEEAAVLPLQTGQRIQLAAVVVLSAAGQVLYAEQGKGKFSLLLRQLLRQWIEPVGIPRRYRIVTTIPVNPQGKRLINQLSDLFTERSH
ncbi:AMP-binding protein [Photobacterium nomapromontoriensis]|uniref:AMP-binding protein n=1 Tax=Photobacterium nomapromontoriensis TaxID=2910237 RepID=UPI003D0AC925